MIKTLYLGQSYENNKIELPLGNVLINGSLLFFEESQNVVINAVANMFSANYPEASLIFHDFPCAKHDSILKYNDSFYVGGSTVQDRYTNYKFYEDLICEYKLRKKYNQAKSPIFVATLDPQRVMFSYSVELSTMIKDSYLYNIFFICLTFHDNEQYSKDFQHHFKIEADLLVINNSVLTNKFEAQNMPKQLSDSSCIDSFIFPAFTKNSNNFFSLPYKLKPISPNLDLDDYHLLLSKDVISYKDVPNINSNTKEECLQMIANKKKLISII